MAATVESSVELQEDIYPTLAPAAAFAASATIVCAVTGEMAAAEVVEESTILCANYCIHRARTLPRFNLAKFNLPIAPTDICISDTFAAIAAVQKDCHIIGEMLASLAAAVEIGGDKYISDTLSDRFLCAADIMGKYTESEITCYATLSCIVSTAIFDILHLAVDASIPAGGKLVIDSDNYLVLLDDENALDKHEGEWVILSRLVEEIQVDAVGASGLSVTMLYTERYL